MSVDIMEGAEAPMEVLQPSAIMALEKAQIDVQVATAHQYPRTIQKFRAGALAMATIDAETAESCCYCRPVGKEQDRSTGKWVQKFAEGPSIRLSEIVAANYGNIRAASRIIEQTERFVKCEGVCHDLESNYAAKSEVVEVTVTKEGQPYSERQRALIAKVALAKAFRDAIFKVVPRALAKPIYEAAKKCAAGEIKTTAERVKRARAWISTLKIDEDRVLAALDLSEWDKITQEHLDTLTGLKTAIADKETTVDEAFPPIAKEPQQGTTAPNKPQAAAPKQENKPAAAPVTPAKVKVAPKPAEAPQAEQTAPAATSQPAPAESQRPEPSDAEAEAELAAAGLAPKQEAPATPAQSTDPELEEQPQDHAEVKALKALGRQSGVTMFQIMGWFIKAGMAKQGQTLGDILPSKRKALATIWAQKLPDIKAMPTAPAA